MSDGEHEKVRDAISRLREYSNIGYEYLTENEKAEINADFDIVSNFVGKRFYGMLENAMMGQKESASEYTKS